jgi:hypothetical protein
VAAKNVVCHLTHNFNNPDSVATAFTATGKVNIALGPSDKLIGWEFGFVQFQKVNNIGFFYAGKKSSDGSISINVHKAPAMTQTLALDSNDTYSPWTKPGPRFTHKAPKITCVTGDHPLTKVGRELVNQTTKATNFLFHIVDEREFVSVFSARDPNGTMQHLAHFDWKLRYDVKFTWKGGTPTHQMQSSSTFKTGKVVQGPPTDQAIVALLPTLAGPQANTLMLAAIVKAINGGQGANRTDNAKHFINVPFDFFVD